MKLDSILSRPPSILTREQRKFYYRQGYLAFPGLIGDEWLGPLRSALAEVVEQTRDCRQSTRKVDIEPDHSSENPRLRRIAYLDEFAPVFWDLCSKSIIPDIAADLLGPNVRFRELMMNFKWAGGGRKSSGTRILCFIPTPMPVRCSFC